MTSFLKADRSQPVALWLFTTALLVLVMVMVGGATRMTDSGLSITEWDPLMGALPPMSDVTWASLFAKYKQIPQYRDVNAGMSLVQFQQIFWWEWSHRLLGRLVGVVFAVPFVYFLIRRKIPRRLILRCVGLFLLGGLQGLVGWWMVKSGLTDRISVAPERLMVHLGLAFILFGCLIWCALEALAGQGRIEAKGPWARGGLLLMVLIFLQCLLGALVAGNRAGRIYNDWPLMNGQLIPKDYAGDGFWNTVAHSLAAVQFNHRILAYVIVIFVAVFAVTAARSRFVQVEVRACAFALAGLVLLQAVVGVATLMIGAPLWLGLIHQATASLVLAVAVALTWRARRT
ncbi:COX15/CtaA family protein [soil metagenome]